MNKKQLETLKALLSGITRLKADFGDLVDELQDDYEESEVLSYDLESIESVYSSFEYMQDEIKKVIYRNITK